MPKVTANNITMNYDQQGTGEPLILIPYLAADHACYAFQVPDYARHFTCISVDLRGTGESAKTARDLYDGAARRRCCRVHAGDGHRKGSCRRPVPRRGDRDVAGREVSAQSPILVAAQQLGKERRLPTDGRRKLADRGEGCRRARDDQFARFSRGASRRSSMRKAGLHRLVGSIRPQPAAAVSAGLHPTVECRSRSRRGSTPRANYRADADHIRAPRSADVDAFRGSTDERHRQFGARRSSRGARTRRFTRTSQSSIRRRWRSCSGMLEQQLHSGPFLLITAGSV